MNWQTDISKIETPHEETRHGKIVKMSGPILLHLPNDPFGEKYKIARLTKWPNGVELFYFGSNTLSGVAKDPDLRYCKIEPPK